jgi:hypothetical protein
LFSNKLTKIPPDTWMEMEQQWRRAFPGG